MSSKSMEEYLKRYQDGGQTKKRKKTKKNGSMMIVEDDTFTAVASTAKQIEYSDEEESEDEIQMALAEKIKRAKKASFKRTFQTASGKLMNLQCSGASGLKTLESRAPKTVHRSKMTGKGRLNDERKETKDREKHEELNQRYKSQNRGVKQIRNREEQLAEMAEIIKEDFTRYADNEKMNEHLKEQLYEDDPMFQMKMRERRTADVRTGTAVPLCQGHWTQNRFSIHPGCRWDGVDRSSGFEAKLALQANQKKAEQSEYYKMVAEFD